jgi:hypothetical protein
LEESGALTAFREGLGCGKRVALAEWSTLPPIAAEKSSINVFLNESKVLDEIGLEVGRLFDRFEAASTAKAYLRRFEVHVPI